MYFNTRSISYIIRIQPNIYAKLIKKTQENQKYFEMTLRIFLEFFLFLFLDVHNILIYIYIYIIIVLLLNILG
jgi:hypothetical protein